MNILISVIFVTLILLFSQMAYKYILQPTIPHMVQIQVVIPMGWNNSWPEIVLPVTNLMADSERETPISYMYATVTIALSDLVSEVYTVHA